MGPFIGFLVLLGPLVFVVLWLPLCLWIARNVAKRFTGSGARWASGAAAFFVALLLPFADSIAGRIYLNHLCSTEAGVKVFQTVELPAENWDEQGKMRFLKSNGDIDQVLLGKKFEWHSVSEPYSTFLLKVDKEHWQFSDGGTQNILAERTRFWWHGGWLGEFSPAPTRGASCPLLSDQYSGNEFKQRQYEQEQNFYSKIFKPVNSQ